MIWFFQRGGEHLQYEIRESSDPAGYEMVVHGPDGATRVERFGDSIGLLERSLELQRNLIQEGWASERAAQRDDWRWSVPNPEKPETKEGDS
jgi:hypothetical protein